MTDWERAFAKYITGPLRRAVGARLNNVTYFILRSDQTDFSVDTPNQSGPCQGILLTFTNIYGDALNVELDWEWKQKEFRRHDETGIAYHLIVRSNPEQMFPVNYAPSENGYGGDLGMEDATRSLYWNRVSNQPLRSVFIWGWPFDETPSESPGSFSGSPQAVQFVFPAGSVFIAVGSMDWGSAQGTANGVPYVGDGDEVLVFSEAEWEQAPKHSLTMRRDVWMLPLWTNDSLPNREWDQITFHKLDEQNGVFLTEPLPDVWPLEIWFASVYDLPLAQFSVSDLACACRQEIHLEIIVPLCLEILELEPLAGEQYEGELLTAVVKLPWEYWDTHDAQKQTVLSIAKQIYQEPALDNDRLREDLAEFLWAMSFSKNKSGLHRSYRDPMSINLSYRRLSSAEFAHLEADPEAASRFFGTLLANADDETWTAYLAEREADERFLEIGDSWHGLHFLLTGDAGLDNENHVPPPLGNVIEGGTNTRWEATYGMVRSLTVEEVREVAAALAPLDEGTLRTRFDLDTFHAANLYPGEESWEEESWSYLYFAFTQVRDFFAAASEAGEMILLSSD